MHLLRQRSFYPIYPPPDHVCIDYDAWLKHAQIDTVPRVILAVSDLTTFNKVKQTKPKNAFLLFIWIQCLIMYFRRLVIVHVWIRADWHEARRPAAMLISCSLTRPTRPFNTTLVWAFKRSTTQTNNKFLQNTCDYRIFINSIQFNSKLLFYFFSKSKLKRIRER